MYFTAPLDRGSRPRASTRYARSDPRAANAALGGGKIHGPSLGGGIMYHCCRRSPPPFLPPFAVLMGYVTNRSTIATRHKMEPTCTMTEGGQMTRLRRPFTALLVLAQPTGPGRIGTYRFSVICPNL
jgi:hypothetical protein